MTNDGWGNKWPSDPLPMLNADDKSDKKVYNYKPVLTDKDNDQIWLKAEASKLSGVWPEEASRQRSNWDKDVASLNWPKAPELTGWDLGTGERTILTTFENDDIKHRVINQTELKQQGFDSPDVTQAITKLIEDNFDTSKFKSQGSNLVDDQANLYFQCESCDKILDPHTKSFAKLQEHRVKAGWFVKWSIDGMGYKVYCAKCVEKMV